MIDFEQFQDKFSDSGQRVMKRAYDESRRRDHNQVAPEHVFVALAELERNFFNELMQSLNVDPQAVSSSLESRLTEVMPGIFTFLVPGHTWGQQATLFTDTKGRTVVFTPDVMPTAAHVGAAYSLGYDVEPYTSMVTRHWFLRAASVGGWLLVLDHEPGNPCRRVKEAGPWFELVEDGK